MSNFGPIGPVFRYPIKHSSAQFLMRNSWSLGGKACSGKD